MMTIVFVVQDDPKLPTDINQALIIATPTRRKFALQGYSLIYPLLVPASTYLS